MGLPSGIPLELFDFQVELVRWLKDRLDEREPGLVEKSRDMGFSVIAGAFAVWLWLFRPGATVCFGSRKEALVDKKGDPKCLFHKIRFIIDHLPGWLKPDGYNKREHDNFMLIVNPENGATITGEAGDNIGRGARALLYFVDEFAFLPRAQLADSALSQTAEVIIYGSSANGIGNLFYNKRSSGNIAVIRLHWTKDPRKSPEWREEQIRRFGEVIVAQEIDIDYTASVEGICIPAKWVASAIAFRKRYADELEPYRSAPRVAGLDVADGGGDESVFTPVAGPLVFTPEGRAEGNTTKTARWAYGLAQRHNVDRVLYDSIGVGAGIGGEFWSLKKEKKSPKAFDYDGVNVAKAPSPRRWFGTDHESGDKGVDVFANLKAELWWDLRQRFERVHRIMTGEVPFDESKLDELIALQDHAKLIPQLSMVLYYIDGKGRIAIESKKELRKRLGDNASPDYAESLMLAYAGPAVTQGVFIGRA